VTALNPKTYNCVCNKNHTMVPYAKDQAAVAKHPPRERAFGSNGGKASANEPSDHGSKASAKKRANTLSAAKHLPERGPKSCWRQSIRQDSTDGQASGGREDTPLQQSIRRGGGALTLLAAKRLLKRRPTTVTAKYPPKEKVIAAEHPLATTPARSYATGETIGVGHLRHNRHS
jgi:hypothetical protein